MRALAIVLAAPFAFACAFEPGHGFATVESASLDARLEPGPARDLGNETVLSDLAYEVHLDSAELTIEKVELQELRGASGGAAFDPASPPPGYSNCHGGHCHADDGRLVDYAEIEAELAGGTASFAPILMLPFGQPDDLLSAERAALNRFDPSDELPRVTLRRVVVHVSRLELTGSVAGGPAAAPLAAPVPFGVDLPLGAWQAGIELAIDRDEPGDFSFELDIVVGGTAFDSLDFAANATAGSIDVVSFEHPLAQPLEAALAESEVRLTVR